MPARVLSTFVTLLASGLGTRAATPAGFEPASQESLFVTYGNVAALDGAVVAREVTQTVPTIASLNKLDGSSFAVLMIDLDIPTDAPHTLLHWMQTGLTQSSSAIALNTTMGSKNAYVFSVPQNEEAFAPYLGPAPPAKVPLSHRYTQILVDTSEASDEALTALKTAAASRLNFVALDILTSAGLADKVVAGNFYNVTNPGPVGSSTPTNSSGNANNPTPSPKEIPVSGAETLYRAGTSLALLMSTVVCFAL